MGAESSPDPLNSISCMFPFHYKGPQDLFFTSKMCKLAKTLPSLEGIESDCLGCCSEFSTTASALHPLSSSASLSLDCMMTCVVPIVMSGLPWKG